MSPDTRRRRGVALVVVLVFLVILSALIIGFFMSVEGEVMASKNYEDSAAVRQLVNSATNIVTGQLVDGTRSTKTRRPPGTAGRILAGERLAWASQPGLIRTWDDTGAGWKIFKLYSSRDMVADFDAGGRYSTAQKVATEVPTAWPQQTALYTDLNEPVLVEDVNGGIDRAGKKMRASYPIVDPLALTQDRVEGFLVTAPPGYGGQFQNGVPQFDARTDPTEFISEKVTANPVPMPVVWIYVLKDGTLTIPNASVSNGRTARWSNQPAAVTPTAANPIVGRFAFWTDDETCKLNINTSSEPTPWDTPRAMTRKDVEYGSYQPAQREYQRFPGHPFSNALSPVLLPGLEPDKDLKEEIYRLIPRVGAGGTIGGTHSITTTPNPILLDRDRLFANADELLFETALDPAHPNQRLAISSDRTNFPKLAPRLTPDRLRRTRFFLTANSRSPEINLFGQPRVSLWPVHATVNLRTPFDKLAAFCSTVADATGSSATSTRGFYFQRRDPTSPTQDISSIVRNKELLSYLSTLTSTEIPGFGGNFRSKWGNDRDQVLTEIFDYIRCTNLKDPQPGATKFAPNGQVTPIQYGGTLKGFGRFHTISQAGLHLISIAERDSNGVLLGVNNSTTQALRNGEKMLEVAFIFTPFSPSVGWPPLQEDMFIQLGFPSTPFKLKDDSGTQHNLTFGSSGRALSNQLGVGPNFISGHNRGGAGGLRGTIAGLTSGGVYPWLVTNLKFSGNKLEFEGGDVTFTLYPGSTATGQNRVQTLVVHFPSGKFPMPSLAPPGWWSINSRYSRAREMPYIPSFKPERSWPPGSAPGFKPGSIFHAGDVVRSVVPKKGDIRLIAGKLNGSADDWTWTATAAGTLWDDASNHFAHIFSEAAGTQFSYGFLNEPEGSTLTGLPSSGAGDQLTPANYHYSRLPEIRPGAGHEFNQWGDFDNGVAQTVDGAYINKPDEGNIAGTQGYPYWSSTFASPSEIYFSPNRLVPSAGMLGSLPTGILRGRPWETLLFRPQPGHPGAANPPDHLLMDLFWMPVVEPYAISEPFSTAGKVNMNYEIAPFSYIHRATALVGALKSEEVLAIPTSPLTGAPYGAAKIYKLWDSETGPDLPSAQCTDNQVKQNWTDAFEGNAPFDQMRKRIDPLKTLLPFEAKFANGEIFRSATQICEMYLPRMGLLDDGSAPESITDYQNGNFWQNHVVTGDNTRERPYANLYAKLTTRSNTFTIHVRAQVLRQLGPRGGGSWREWREGRDKQMAEYRGSTTIERYIDPADPTMVDFAKQSGSTVDNSYRTRILATKKYTPE